MKCLASAVRFPCFSDDIRVVGTITRGIIVPKIAAANSELLNLFIERFMERYYIKNQGSKAMGLNLYSFLRLCSDLILLVNYCIVSPISREHSPVGKLLLCINYNF